MLPLASAAAGGITIDSLLGGEGGQFDSPLRGGFWILLSLLISALVLWKPSKFASPFVVLVFLPLAACAHCLHELAYQRADILLLVGSVEQSAVLDGVIDRPVVLRRHPLAEWRNQRDESPWQTQFELSVSRIRLGREMRPCRGRVLVIVDADCGERRPGDEVRIFGRMSAFTAPTNPGEPDRRAVYRQRQLHARATCDTTDQVIRLGRRPSWGQYFYSWIASIATRGRESLMRHMDEPTGALAAALVLGQREFVDETTRDLLLVTGTAHLLSVSGLHLAIVVAIAGWIATIARFPLPARIVWILLICMLYTGITGARPPVVRAAILVGTLMLALWMKRPGQPINTLALAAIILMAINPQLLFNMGVQLSFLAVTTLLTCSRQAGQRSESVQALVKQEQRLNLLVDQSRTPVGRFVRAWGYRIGQAFWFSGCVTLISMPIVWQHFHVVTPVSIATNVCLGPVLFIALASGVATVVVGLLFPPCAIYPAAVCEWSMGSMQRIIEVAASVPGGHHWLPSPPSWWVATFYLIIAATMWLAKGRTSSLIRYGWICVWFCMAWWMATSQPRLAKGSVEAIFVDVGHGTCVVLRFSNDDVWLYDCGRLGNDTYSSRGIDSVLWSLGVTRLSGVFLSHADADHFNALPGVLRRFEVQSIFTPPNLFKDPEPALALVSKAVQSHRVGVIELRGGSAVVGQSQTMRVLHPPADRVRGSDNANSLVLRIDCGARTLILPGDLEPPGTDLLIHCDRPFPGGILMAPHHGSLRMDAASVLQWSRPGVTIVSGGRRAGRPEVHQMLAETGSAVHVTSEVGAIRIEIDQAGAVNVRSWKETPW